MRGEQEGIVPSTWIRDNVVYWPNGVDASKKMDKGNLPSKSWRQFKLKKIKFSSGETFKRFLTFSELSSKRIIVIIF